MLCQSDKQWNKFHIRFYETWQIFSDVIGWLFIIYVTASDAYNQCIFPPKNMFAGTHSFPVYRHVLAKKEPHRITAVSEL
jgi:hypothetical protein